MHGILSIHRYIYDNFKYKKDYVIYQPDNHSLYLKYKNMYAKYIIMYMHVYICACTWFRICLITLSKIRPYKIEVLKRLQIRMIVFINWYFKCNSKIYIKHLIRNIFHTYIIEEYISNKQYILNASPTTYKEEISEFIRLPPPPPPKKCVQNNCVCIPAFCRWSFDNSVSSLIE